MQWVIIKVSACDYLPTPGGKKPDTARYLWRPKHLLHWRNFRQQKKSWQETDGWVFLTPKSGLCWQILTAHIWLTTHRVARGSCNGGQFIRVQREAFRKPDSAQRQVLHPSAAVNNNLHPIELQEVVAHQGLMIFGRFVDFGGIGLLYTGSHINERAMKKSHI